MWLKNTWYIAAFEHEFDQPLVARRLLDVPIIMYRTSDGSYAALEDVCPHRLLPLSCGKRVDDEIQCGYHGMRFSSEGKCTEVPGQQQIPAAACVTTYPITAMYGLIWIWLGSRELADPSLIPDLHWHDDPGWTCSRGYHHVQADFRLMNDNLLDLSHETYVHNKTIGNGEEETIASYPLTVTTEADSVVRAHREMSNIEAPPFFAMILGHQGAIDRWQTAINFVSGLNITVATVCPVGVGRDQASISYVMHLLTPETENSTHYFWANVRNYRLEDTELTETIRQAVLATFDEDKTVLEEQQRQIETRNAVVPRVAIRLDEAPLRARRLLDGHVKAEAANSEHVVRPVPLVRDMHEASAQGR